MPKKVKTVYMLQDSYGDWQVFDDVEEIECEAQMEALDIGTEIFEVTIERPSHEIVATPTVERVD